MHILVLDDDEEVREMLRVALTTKGHDVTTLADPTEFPYFNKELCPCPQDSPCADILLSDIVMPNLEGIALFKKLKSCGCQPLMKGNVAIMSGFLTIHYMNELNDLGIQYFRKPFRLNEIYDWVEHCQVRIQETSHQPTDSPTAE